MIKERSEGLVYLKGCQLTQSKQSWTVEFQSWTVATGWLDIFKSSHPNSQVDHMAPFSPVANTWSGIIISALTPASRGFFPSQDGGRLRFRRLGWHASKSDDIILIVSLHPSENSQGSPKYLPTAHPITRRVAEVFTMLAGLLGNMAGRHSLKVEGWPMHNKEQEP